VPIARHQLAAAAHVKEDLVMNLTTPAAPLMDSPKPVILVVDDAAIYLSLLNGILLPTYQVLVASRGEDALLAARGTPRPDLILLDVIMPGMDGFEVLRQLRESELTRDIPVIILTGLDDEDSELRGIALGAADYLHKPPKKLIVLSRISVHLAAKSARDMLRRNNERLVHQVADGLHALEQAQQQLLQSEKMAAMGQLAAGIAHEINNPIGFVGSNLGSLEGYIGDLMGIVEAYTTADSGDDPRFSVARQRINDCNFAYLKEDLPQLITETREGVSRVRKIVSDLKEFSHAGDNDWHWADVHHGLDTTLNIVWNELKYKCTVTKHYGELPKLHCLPSQLNQVFMNLLVNAAQAIESKGEITITTECLDVAHVRISISDNGSGMPPDVLAHIFQPFYTTKPVGKGTGLGLSLARGIIERHHGKIDVLSVVGKGTTFTITLPVDEAQSDSLIQQT
jgi:signal transduction histidine kinase